jgi:hypothetical protein
MGAASVLTRGQAGAAVNTFLTIPGTLSQQGSWEFDLAMCALESGMPEDAATHFTKALTLAPDLAVRPIAAYYLEKMSKPVPALTKSTGAAGAKTGSTTEKLGLIPDALATQATEKPAPPAPPDPLKPSSTQPSPPQEAAKTAVPQSAGATTSRPK